jgi:hypothetical protein
VYKLSDKGLLIHPHIGQYGGRAEDKEVTRFVENSFNVAGAGRWNKKLIPQRLAVINSHAQKARNLHQELTVPWDFAGTALLPNELYFEYMEKMQPLKDNFLMEVDRLIQDYNEILESEKVRLGSLFKDSDYPPPWKLANKFCFTISIYPVPESGDFRVSLADYEVDRLKQEMEKNVMDRVVENTRGLWLRVHEATKDLIDRLNGSRSIRYDSPVVDNLKKLASILPALNFAQDQDLDDMAKEIDSKLTKFKPEEIRDDEVVKEQVQKEAEKIFERISQFI